MKKVFGIDLGTTYSCIACIDENDKAVVLKNAEGELTTPSVIYFESNENIVVGNPAKESAVLYPNEVVSFVKRSMGHPGVSWNIHGIDRTAEEISSYTLKKIVNDAVEILHSENKLPANETITDVVITCPAYFGINEREATRKAGVIAGLNVLAIINEPTAAAISYGVMDAGRLNDLSDRKVVLVYDLGGGTFDVTMIEMKPEAIKVICTGGDHSLGGKLWDDRIIEYLAGEFREQTGNTEDLLDDDETFQELVLSAERAKKMLSARDKAPIAINYKGERARIELSRKKFDEITEDLLERTIMLTKEMLEEAEKKGYSKKAVNEILLVGGSTRMPQIINRITSEFNITAKNFDPDEAVAKGAAVYAARQSYYNELIENAAEGSGKTAEDIKKEIKSGKTNISDLIKGKGSKINEALGSPEIDIINVTSRSFGTLAYKSKSENSDEKEEILFNMILKNSELPVSVTKKFYTIGANQRTVGIHVMESLSSEEIINPAQGNQIGETVLELPEGLEEGSPFEVTFIINESGLLEINAVELSSGGKVEARFETVDAMTDTMVLEAKQRNEDAFII